MVWRPEVGTSSGLFSGKSCHHNVIIKTFQTTLWPLCIERIARGQKRKPRGLRKLGAVQWARPEMILAWTLVVVEMVRSRWSQVIGCCRVKAASLVTWLASSDDGFFSVGSDGLKQLSCKTLKFWLPLKKQSIWLLGTWTPIWAQMSDLSAVFPF